MFSTIQRKDGSRNIRVRKNQSKPRLIYIHDYNIPDIEDYSRELKKEYNLLDVKKATWIKIKNIAFTPLLLTFKEKEPPIFIEIPGLTN